MYLYLMCMMKYVYEDNIVADKILDDSRRLNISSGNILCTIHILYMMPVIWCFRKN